MRRKKKLHLRKETLREISNLELLMRANGGTIFGLSALPGINCETAECGGPSDGGANVCFVP